MDALEEAAQRPVTHRLDVLDQGLRDLTIPGELRLAAANLVQAGTVAIVVGNALERAERRVSTDGPLGAMALVHALLVMGKRVLLLADPDGAKVMEAAVRHRRLDAHAGMLLPVVVYPRTPRQGKPDQIARASMRFAARVLGSRSEVGELPPVDHIVSVGKSGRDAAGRFFDVKGDDMSASACRIDDLFVLCENEPARRCRTTAIVDHGSCIGVGKVLARVERSRRLRKVITCVTPATNLIAASVVTWGCYALTGALALLSNHFSTTSSIDPARLMPTRHEESSLLDAIIEAGAVDEVSCQPDRFIDGLHFSEHAAMLEEMRAVVDTALGGLQYPDPRTLAPMQKQRIAGQAIRSER